MADPGMEGSGADKSAWTALACALLGFGILTLLASLKFAANNYGNDVGNFLQAFYRSLDGAWMDSTLNGWEGNYPRWESHTEFILALLVPIFALFPHATTLFAAQAAALAAGGWAVYVLARSRWGHGWQACLCSLAYWAFPFLFHLQLCGFHADPFFIAPYLLAWHFHKTGRDGWFWAMIAVATSVKEYACVFNFLIGLSLLRENRKRAMGLFAISLGQFLILTPVTNWLFRDAGIRLNMETHIVGAQAGVIGVFKTMAMNVADPQYALKTGAVIALFGWSWIRRPSGLILVVPIYAGLTLLATDTLFVRTHFALLIPALFIGHIEAFAGMDPVRRGRQVLFALLLPSALLLVGHPSSQVSIHLREVFLHPEYRNLFHYRVTPHDRLTDSLIAAIPKELALSAEEYLRPKGADREWAFDHPHPKDSLRADRFIFDFFEHIGISGHEERRRRCAALFYSPDFSLEHFEDGVILLAKTPSPSGPFPARAFSWETVTDSTSDTARFPSGGRAVRAGGIPVAASPSLRKEPQGYALEVAYRGRFAPAEAVVSVFTRPSGDSLRVLHLPGYLLARLSQLPAGRYRERLRFQGPPDLLEGGWQWELRLYKDNVYLPLAGRADQVLERRPLGTAGPAPSSLSHADSAE